ncbi:MAG: hypothetical protein VR68_12320 [Peptococcaceae bacterium BRH_c4a]|nr:MAG: hypothetical protein VR68_12320 [Peptococcaceae bacterium BRH_c4a]
MLNMFLKNGSVRLTNWQKSIAQINLSSYSDELSVVNELLIIKGDYCEPDKERAKETLQNLIEEERTVDSDRALNAVSGGVGLVYKGINTEKLMVKEILKRKKGSIKNAPLEKGSPSWDDIQNMTMEQIDEYARKSVPGFKTIRKLLNDKRFDK